LKPMIMFSYSLIMGDRASLWPNQNELRDWGLG